MTNFLRNCIRIALPVLLSFTVSISRCSNVSEIAAMDPNYGVTWMYFPDGDDNPQVIDLTQESQMKQDPKFLFLDPDRDSKVTMYIYNKDQPPRYLKKGNTKSRDNFTLDDSYDPDKPTKIIIHGWQNDHNSPAIQLIKDAYLERGDVNVIGVDWSPLALEKNYFSSASATRDVGGNVASVIDYMVINRNAELDDIHVIGHSLGAHTAGYAGMYTKSGRIGRITGLDPALPGFQDTTNPNQKLDPSDAQFVDVIHTCSGLLGHNRNLGHADFYPNGGRAAQPGCGDIRDFIGACSHGRAYRYFAETIRNKNGFMSQSCNSYDDYKNKKCHSEPVPMGDGIPKSARGPFYLDTTSGPKTFGKYSKIYY